ncbi:MAG: hypothetical protein HC921_02385 [Synechococcaceae cyanobacterium SM2_3_1]|nr:hypothetical protein [Synechococcaceae cyanobacterium SM2_3_1]
MSIVVVDVESDGPIPANHSMVCASIDTELAEIREIAGISRLIVSRHFR